MKKLISILMAIILFAGMFTCLVGCTSVNNPLLTRGEWISLLSLEFGLDDYVTEEPAFKDIKKDDELFVNVQSCVDWGILDNSSSDKLNPDKTARIEFALETAIAVADVSTEGKTLAEFAKSEQIIGDSYLDINGNLTQEKAESIILWAKDLYHNKEIEEVRIVELVEGVKEVNSSTNVVSFSDSTAILAGGEASEYAVGDVIVLPPSAEYPDGYARKITDVKANGDGTYTFATEDPAIEEVFADLDISTTVAPNVADINFENGFSLSSGGASGMGYQKAEVGTLEKTDNDAVSDAMDKGVSFSIDVDVTGGNISLAKNWASLFGAAIDHTGKVSSDVNLGKIFGVEEDIEVGGEMGFSTKSLVPPSTAGKLFDINSTIPDKSLFGKDPYDNTDAIEAYKAGNISLDELKNQLDLTENQTEKNAKTMTNKFSGSYKITGNVSITNLYVTPVIKLKKTLGIPTGIETLSVEVNYDVNSSLTVSGIFKEELCVCTCPIPVVGGVSIALKFILFADLNGNITVSAVIGNNAKFEYSGGQTKKSATNTQSVTASISAVLDVGPAFGIDIQFLGLTIVDIKLSAAVRFKTGANVKYMTTYSLSDDSITINRKTEYGFTGDLYVPIIKLSIGQKKSFANTLKLSFSWTLVGENKAYHKELFNMEDIIWEETQVIKLRPEEEEESTTENLEEDLEYKRVTDYLKLDGYFVSISEGESFKINIANLPEGYSAADLVWSSDNGFVASVSDGVVTGESNGSAVISVMTSDGIFKCYCSVTVAGESVEFTPLEDDLVYAA